MTDARTDRLDEHNDTLWLLVVSPVVWSLHFMLCYITAAIWCAKMPGETDPLGWVREAVAWYTVVALAIILAVLYKGYRAHSYGTATVPHDFDTRDDRHRFLGFATVLLSGLSAVATIFTALAAVFFETCR